MKLNSLRIYIFLTFIVSSILSHAQHRVLFVRGADRSAGFHGASTDQERTNHLADIYNNSTSNKNHGWGQLRTVLTNNGFIVSQVEETVEAGAPSTGQTNGVAVDFTSINLNSYDVVVFGSNNAVYNQASINAVENYIRGGGGAIFISDADFGGDWSDAPNSDQQFLDRFGLIMHQDQGTYSLERSKGQFEVANHPVFSGVNHIFGEGVSPIQVGNPSAGVNVTVLAEAQIGVRLNQPPYTEEKRGPIRSKNSNDAAIFYATAGAGRILGHYDRNTFFNQNGKGTDINQYDHIQYAINLFTVAAEGTNPAPQPNPQPNPVPSGNVVTGRFFIDNNANEVQNGGDTNVNGATVQLVKGSTVITTTTTDINGEYTISGFADGWYKVLFVKPSGSVFVSGDVGSNDAIDSDVTSPSTGRTDVEQYTGDTVIDLDAGIVGDVDPAPQPNPQPNPVPSGNVVTGRFFIDNNANEVQNGGDTNVNGATVQLVKGSTVITTTTTDINGEYTISGFADGWYKVLFVKPSGSVFVSGDVGSNDAIDSDVTSPSTGRTDVEQFTGDTVIDLDAGIEGEGGTAPSVNKISGRVFFDNDGNDLQSSGDTNVSGVTVQLVSGNNVIATTTTSSGESSGLYSFVGFANDWYKVRFIKPSSTSFVIGNIGSNDSIDSDVWDRVNGYSSARNYTGSTREDVDAGLR